MDLHKETVCAAAVVRDSMQIFVGQARSKNVELEFSCEPPTTSGGGAPCLDNAQAILSSDFVSCDRFKIAQVRCTSFDRGSQNCTPLIIS